MPEQIELAGGSDALGKAGANSVRIDWSNLLTQAPEVVIVSPWGHRIEESAKLARQLPIVRGARVYAKAANAYFARPGLE